jgi:hypothetical protein
LKRTNRLLMAVVAAVAVAGVAIGGILAAQNGPEAKAGSAAPLPDSTATSTTPAVPLKAKVDPAKLARGRDPQLTYVRGRTVLGGIGKPVAVPGTAEVIAVGRLWELTLAVLMNNVTNSELVVLDETGKQVSRMAGVDSLVTSADGQAAAYASGGRFTAHYGKGGTVYFQEHGSQPIQLARPGGYDLAVAAVLGQTVYFRSGSVSAGAWSLYRWQVDKKVVTKIARLASPVAVSGSGALTAGLSVFTDGGMCTAVTELSSVRQRWRTCQYQLTNFSPGDVFAIGIPPGSAVFGDPLTAALDARNGNLLREWTGPSIRGAVAEDDDHVLLQWHDKPEPQSRSALIRCSVSTGGCELATPLETGLLVLGS